MSEPCTCRIQNVGCGQVGRIRATGNGVQPLIVEQECLLLEADVKHSEVQNLFPLLNAPPPSALFYSVAWVGENSEYDFKKNGNSFLQCAALPFFVIMTLIGISGSHLPSSRVCVSSSTMSTILPVFLHSSTKPIRMQQVTIPTSIHPVTVRFHLPLFVLPAARASEAREMYSVSIVSFGAELGRPSTRLMFNSSLNITKRFPSRCFVIKSAGLIVPRIFSILSYWFFSFCWSHKYFVSIGLIAPLPLRRANPRAAAASVQIRT